MASAAFAVVLICPRYSPTALKPDELMFLEPCSKIQTASMDHGKMSDHILFSVIQLETNRNEYLCVLILAPDGLSCHCSDTCHPSRVSSLEYSPCQSVPRPILQHSAVFCSLLCKSSFLTDFTPGLLFSLGLVLA